MVRSRHSSKQPIDFDCEELIKKSSRLKRAKVIDTTSILLQSLFGHVSCWVAMFAVQESRVRPKQSNRTNSKWKVPASYSRWAKDFAKQTFAGSGVFNIFSRGTEVSSVFHRYCCKRAHRRCLRWLLTNRCTVILVWLQL